MGRIFALSETGVKDVELKKRKKTISSRVSSACLENRKELPELFHAPPIAVPSEFCYSCAY